MPPPGPSDRTFVLRWLGILALIMAVCIIVLHAVPVKPMFKGNFDMSALDEPLHIDIPVKLEEVKVAFSVPGLAFEGDLPASIFHFQLIENDIADWNAKAQVIAVFHTNAGHVTLNDKVYNTERNVSTGNPYKDLVSDLMKRNMHFELCGATARVHNWRNEDLLPGIKAARLVEIIAELR